MTTTSTAEALRFAADTLGGLPGLPVVFAIVCENRVTLQLSSDDADEDTRAVAVDMIAAVLGLTPQALGGSYRAESRVGPFWVTVHAPNCRVVRDPAQVPA